MTQLADTCINKFQLRKRTPIIFLVQHCEFAYKISEAKSQERLIHKLKETGARLIFGKISTSSVESRVSCLFCTFYVFILRI